MYIQKIINNNQIDISSLFMRINNNSVSYNTYFNCFSYSDVIKYLDGHKLTISFLYKGNAIFNIVTKSKRHKRIIYSDTLSSNELKEYSSEVINLDSLEDKGILYIEFINMSNDFISKDIEYRVIDSKEHKVDIIIVITTYHREDYVLRNIKRLEECRSFIKKVLIIDNGNTLSNKIKSDDYINIIPNKNLGGSGGFTRGMIEAKKIGCSHIFLMDDDISFLTETLERSFNFIKSLNDKHRKDWLGFSMLISDKPTVQYEMGSNWNGIKMMINNHNIDLNNEKSLLRNINHQRYNYSAWWSIIMPISVIDDYGLPLPFFIKFDDIEYGLRRKNDEIIFNNGISVWHENFKRKLSHVTEYYLMRNALFTNLLRKRYPLVKNLLRYTLKYWKAVLRFDYKTNLMINIGVNDYIKGISVLDKTNNEEYYKYLIDIINNNKLYYLKSIPLFFAYIFKILVNHRKLKRS